MLKKLVVLLMLFPAALWSQEDRHDEMLCNCREYHKAGEKDNFTENAYAHDHDDGWLYYHFRSFSRKHWTEIISDRDDQGRVVNYPHKWTGDPIERRSYIVNGSCGDMHHKRSFNRTILEKINHTFSGSRLSRATWEQLKEVGVSIEGTSTIGTKGAVSAGVTTLEGSQGFSVKVGTQLHESMQLTKGFEASVTVTDFSGQEFTWDEADELEYDIPPCHVAVITSLTLFEHETRKYERKPHITVCKYEGTGWDTYDHATKCPQGKCQLILHGRKGIHNSLGVFVRPVDLQYDKQRHIIPNDFVCPDCTGLGKKKQGDGEGETGPGGI